jgi:hypothetical protein
MLGSEEKVPRIFPMWAKKFPHLLPQLPTHVSVIDLTICNH